MKIGNKEYESVIVVNKDNEPVAVIDDMHIVEKDGYKVIFEAAGKQKINTVDEAMDALKALSVFMFTQRNYIKSENYIGICGDLEAVKKEIKKHLSISSKENG